MPFCYEQSNGECNTTISNIIWVKVPRIPANGNTTIYIETSDTNYAKNGTDVFDFYDDFSVEDPNWILVNTNPSYASGSPTMGYENGWIYQRGTDSGGYIKYNIPYSSGEGWAAEEVVKLVNYPGNAGFDCAICFAAAGARAYAYDVHKWTLIINGTKCESSMAIQANVPYRISLRVYKNHQELWVNETLLKEATVQLNYPIDSNFIILQGGADAYTVDYRADWLALRKYIYPEPSSKVNKEEPCLKNETVFKVIIHNPTSIPLDFKKVKGAYSITDINTGKLICSIPIIPNTTFIAENGDYVIKPSGFRTFYLSSTYKDEKCEIEEGRRYKFCIVYGNIFCKEFRV